MSLRKQQRENNVEYFESIEELERDGKLLVMLSACSKIDKTDVSFLPECYYEVYYHHDDENKVIEFNSYEYFEDKYEGREIN